MSPSCAKCGNETEYRKIKLSNGRRVFLCRQCWKVWEKLYEKRYPNGIGEPQWMDLWNEFIRGYKFWSVS